MLYAYEIISLIPKGESKVQCHQHIVASTFQQVLDHLKADIADERTEILSITRYGPVISIYERPPEIGDRPPQDPSPQP